ncbi:hypothetical protein FOA52_013876 [Chlamydomonas sp. UWO 241]|nr:hypothetical protein FOA52_013876 [Chlamydomonas sp. UWO 241]
MMRHGRADVGEPRRDPQPAGDLQTSKRERILRALQKLNDRDTQKAASEDLLAIVHDLDADSMPMLMSAIANDAVVGAQKVYARKECARALGVLASEFCPVAGAALQPPFLAKILAQLKKYLGDADSGVREAGSEAAGLVARGLADASAPVGGLLKMLGDCMADGKKETQAAAATGLGLCAPFISPIEPALAKELLKKLASPAYHAPHALMGALGCVDAATGQPEGLIKASAGTFAPHIPAIIGCPPGAGGRPPATGALGSLVSKDWFLRRAACDLLRCAALTYGPQLEGPAQCFDASNDACLSARACRALDQFCRFDKVKEVRDTAREALVLMEAVREYGRSGEVASGWAAYAAERLVEGPAAGGAGGLQGGVAPSAGSPSSSRPSSARPASAVNPRPAAPAANAATATAAAAAAPRGAGAGPGAPSGGAAGGPAPGAARPRSPAGPRAHHPADAAAAPQPPLPDPPSLASSRGTGPRGGGGGFLRKGGDGGRASPSPPSSPGGRQGRPRSPVRGTPLNERFMALATEDSQVVDMYEARERRSASRPRADPGEDEDVDMADADADADVDGVAGPHSRWGGAAAPVDGRDDGGGAGGDDGVRRPSQEDHLDVTLGGAIARRERAQGRSPSASSGGGAGGRSPRVSTGGGATVSLPAEEVRAMQAQLRAFESQQQKLLETIAKITAESNRTITELQERMRALEAGGSSTPTKAGSRPVSGGRGVRGARASGSGGGGAASPPPEADDPPRARSPPPPPPAAARDGGSPSVQRAEKDADGVPPPSRFDFGDSPRSSQQAAGITGLPAPPPGWGGARAGADAGAAYADALGAKPGPARDAAVAKLVARTGPVWREIGATPGAAEKLLAWFTAVVVGGDASVPKVLPWLWRLADEGQAGSVEVGEPARAALLSALDRAAEAAALASPRPGGEPLSQKLALLGQTLRSHWGLGTAAGGSRPASPSGGHGGGGGDGHAAQQQQRSRTPSPLRRSGGAASAAPAAAGSAPAAPSSDARTPAPPGEARTPTTGGADAASGAKGIDALRAQLDAMQAGFLSSPHSLAARTLGGGDAGRAGG